ncbi:MAG: PH domain-containing protein [Gammaproteobacteria bacterium]|nr:PH domain-containing protein [Gammaproteobacteria bacterium]
MTFAARWSKMLIVVSVVTTGVCLVAGFAAGHVQPWLGAAVMSMPAVALLFCVRGYTLKPDLLLVKRLLWSTEIPLRGLRSADADPTLLAGSWRTFGNGGFFSVTGWFYSRTLGRYRAFVTNRSDAVILRFVDRTVVVSPDQANTFAEQVLTSAR